MRRRLVLSCAIAAVAAAAGPSVAAAANYIVVLKDTSAQSPAGAALDARDQGAQIGYVYDHALRGYSATLSDALLARLRNSADVAFVQPDMRWTATGTQTSPPSYGLDRVDQRNLPLNGSFVYNRTGAGVTAYGIDSGIRTSHAQFGGRARHGYDAIDGSLPADDCNGHGTHTAGTIGGSLTGVAKDVALVAVRVLDCGGSGSTSGIVAGIDWVVADHLAGRPAVANISIGANAGVDAAFDAAIRRMIADGVVTAVSAGNGVGNGILQQNACNFSPGSVTEALVVSSVNSNDQKPLSSNIGSCVDLFAPGDSIISTWNTSDTATASSSGTSMAAPHVAGTAAQYLEYKPTATQGQVQAAIVNNATAGVVKSPGSGSPNRLLYTRFIPAPTGNTAPVASFTNSCSGLTCSFTDTSTDPGGSIVSRSWSFGDGGTSTAANPSRTYAAPGTYNVSLTVTDNGGLSSTTARSITVGTVTDPDPTTPTLTSGVARSGTNGAAGTFKHYKVAIPSGAASVRLDLVGPTCGLLACNPDLDVFGRNGAKPTTSAFHCSGETGSSTETCTISGPPAGYTYVGVYTYSGTSGKTFSIKATVT